MANGYLLGGIVDGYMAQRQDARHQADADFKKKENDRILANQALDDELNKETALYIQQQFTQQTPAIQPAQSVVAGGLNGGAQGSSAPTQNPVAAGIQEKPKAFEPTHDNMIDLAKFRANWRLKKGDFKGAMEEHKNAMAFAADKLQKEADARSRAVNSAIAGIAKGDYSGVPAVYDMIPDGHKLSGIGKNANGTITMKVVDKSGTPLPDVTFKSDEHLANAVEAVSNPDVLLKHWDNEFKRNVDLIKANAEKTRAEADKQKSSAESGRRPTDLMRNTEYIKKTIPGIDEKEALSIAQGKSDRFSASQPDIFGGITITNSVTGEAWKMDKNGSQIGHSAAKGGNYKKNTELPQQTRQKPHFVFRDGKLVPNN